MHAAFILRQKLGLTLQKVVAKISLNTADSLVFGDQGEICEDKRADLGRVTMRVTCPWDARFGAKESGSINRASVILP